MDGSASPNEFYALPPECYVVKNALAPLINGLAKAHWQACHIDGHSRLYKVTHLCLAVIEAVPLVGHIVALFELIVVRSTRACMPYPRDLRGRLPEPQEEPVRIPSENDQAPQQTPQNSSFSPSLPEQPPLVPEQPPELPVPDMAIPFCPVPLRSPIDLIPPMEDNGDGVVHVVINVGPIVPEAPEVPEALLGAMVPVSPRLEFVPQIVLPPREVIMLSHVRGSSRLLLIVNAAPFPVERLVPPVPEPQLVPQLLAPLAAVEAPAQVAAVEEPSWWSWMPASAWQAASNAVTFTATIYNMENTHTVRTLDTWLTRMAPALNQLYRERFGEVMNRFIVFRNPTHLFRLAEVGARYLAGAEMDVNASSAEVQYALCTMMRAHCKRLSPELLAPAGSGLPEVARAHAGVESMINVMNHALNRIDDAHAAQWLVRRKCELAKRTVAHAISRPAFSPQQAQVQAERCIDAICQTMNEALQRISEHNGQGAMTARALEGNAFCQCLLAASKPLLSSLMGQTFYMINEQINAQFTKKFVVDQAGNILKEAAFEFVSQSVLPQVQESFALMKQELFTSCPLLQEYYPLLSQGMAHVGAGFLSLTEMEKIFYELHILQYLKHVLVLYDAVTRSGQLDFNRILASKEGMGDPDVAHAVTALCSFIGRENPELTQYIEMQLRNGLAMYTLMYEMQNMQSDLNDFAVALRRDGFVGDRTCIAAERVNALMCAVTDQAIGEMVAWWNSPYCPEIEALKRKMGRFQGLLAQSGAVAFAVPQEAPHAHATQALSGALEQAGKISVANQVQAVGVQAIRLPLNYLIFGDFISALSATGVHVARATAIQVGVGGAEVALRHGIHVQVSALKVDNQLAGFVAQLCARGDYVLDGISNGQLENEEDLLR